MKSLKDCLFANDYIIVVIIISVIVIAIIIIHKYVFIVSRHFNGEASWQDQGRPVNVKHDARCVMGKVGGGKTKPKLGGGILICCYKFAVIG